MTVTVAQLQLTPVKGAATVPVRRATVTDLGLAGDRAYSVHDDAGEVLTARREGALLAVRPVLEGDGAAADGLTLDVAGRVVRGPVVLGERAEGEYLGKRFAGRVVEGPFGAALSAHLGRAVRLVRHDDGAEGWDEEAISLVGRASLDELATHGGVDTIDRRRFRMGIELAGLGPRGEDAWIGREVAIGGAVVHVVARAERCIITTRNPDHGRVDLQVLRTLAAYRGRDDVCMGVLGRVLRGGEVRVGDRAAVAATAA